MFYKNILNLIKKDNFKFLQCIAIFAVVMFLTMFLLCCSAYAAGSFQKLNLLDNQFQVIKNTSNYSPDINDYPFNGSAVKSIGLPDLWGKSKGLVQYMGEIPYSLKDTDAAKLYRMNNSDTIDGKERYWTLHSDLQEGDIVPDSEDLHIKAMANTSGANGFYYVVYLLVSGINYLTALPLKLIMLLKDIDLSAMLNLFNSDGKLADLFNTLFLISPDGVVSPYLILMLILFMFSLVTLVIRIFKGGSAGKELIGTLGWLLASLCVAGIALNTQTSNLLPKWSVDLASNLSNGISLATSEDSGVYSYNTGDLGRDNSATQYALLQKMNIDTYIAMQFGVGVGELNLNKTDKGYLFGQNQTKIIKEITGSETGFEISNGENKVNNLGYYFWAANSNVSQNPVSADGIQNASNDRVLNVIDFLNSARADAVANKDTKTVNKIDKIINNFWAPDYSNGIGKIFLISLLNLAIAYALVIIVFFMTYGKIIVVIGFFAVPILPGLMLFEKTRKFAKTLTMTYVVGFARYIIGLLFFTFTITIATILTGQGSFGIIIAIIVMFMLGKSMPSLVQYINNMVSRYEGEFMRKPSGLINSYAQNVANSRKQGVRASRTSDGGTEIGYKDVSTSGRFADAIGKGVAAVGMNRDKTNSNKNDSINRISDDNEEEYSFNENDSDNESKKQDKIQDTKKNTITEPREKSETPQVSSGDKIEDLKASSRDKKVKIDDDMQPEIPISGHFNNVGTSKDNEKLSNPIHRDPSKEEIDDFFKNTWKDSDNTESTPNSGFGSENKKRNIKLDVNNMNTPSLDNDMQGMEQNIDKEQKKEKSKNKLVGSAGRVILNGANFAVEQLPFGGKVTKFEKDIVDANKRNRDEDSSSQASRGMNR